MARAYRNPKVLLASCDRKVNKTRTAPVNRAGEEELTAVTMLDSHAAQTMCLPSLAFSRASRSTKHCDDGGGGRGRKGENGTGFNVILLTHHSLLSTGACSGGSIPAVYRCTGLLLVVVFSIFFSP